jgi:ABC-type Fe3+-hydroxamate transport system substrate-binding protein
MARIRKLASILVIVLFMVSFAGVAVSSETPQGTMMIKGTIVDINVGSGEVTVKDETGKAVTLTAGSGIELATFNGGDKVIIEYSGDGDIKSITMQK